MFSLSLVQRRDRSPRIVVRTLLAASIASLFIACGGAQSSNDNTTASAAYPDEARRTQPVFVAAFNYAKDDLHLSEREALLYAAGASAGSSDSESQAIVARLREAFPDGLPGDEPASAGEDESEGSNEEGDEGSGIQRVRVATGDLCKGPTDALVTIVTFSDYQCPFCSRLEPTLAQVQAEHPNQVRLCFRDNPLPFHPNAMPAAIAAREAHAQRGLDSFWRMHDHLFSHNTELDRDDLVRYAQEMQLDGARFARALDGATHQPAIQADMDAAAAIGARGTPASFVNGRSVMGAQPYENFNTIVLEEIRIAEALIAGGATRAQVYARLQEGAASQIAARPTPSREARPERATTAHLDVPANAPTRGPANAPVTIQVISDFQCPFCSRLLPTLAQVEEQYRGRIRLVWRNYPLPFHQNASPMAQAAMEIQAQAGSDAFYSFHDKVFAEQREWSGLDGDALRSYIEGAARGIRGVNLPRLRRALDAQTHQAALQADMTLIGNSISDFGTPTCLINDRVVMGAQPFAAFQTAIDAELAAIGNPAAPAAPAARSRRRAAR